MPSHKNMPAAEPSAMMPNTASPAFENAPCVTPTALAAPVESAFEELALALASPLELAVAPPLSLIVPVDEDCAIEPLLLAVSGSVEFLLISSNGGVQMTTSTLLLRHSPSSKKLCWSLAEHIAVQGNGLPIAVLSFPEQHAYISQKAWSLKSASLLMTHPPSRPDGRPRG